MTAPSPNPVQCKRCEREAEWNIRICNKDYPVCGRHWSSVIWYEGQKWSRIANSVEIAGRLPHKSSGLARRYLVKRDAEFVAWFFRARIAREFPL